MTSTTKNIIIFSIIGVVLIGGVIFFIRQSPDQASLVSSSNGVGVVGSDTGTDVNNSAVAQNFLSLLLSVNSIKLDDSIFSDPAFMSLHDSTITLTPESTTGRPNPFAPIGVGSIGTTTTPTNPTSPSTTSTTTQ